MKLFLSATLAMLVSQAYAGIGVQSIYPSSGGTDLFEFLWILICLAAAAAFGLGSFVAVFTPLFKFHEWVTRKYPNNMLLSFLTYPLVLPCWAVPLLIEMIR